MVGVEALRDDGVGIEDRLDQLAGLVTFADIGEVWALGGLAVAGVWQTMHAWLVNSFSPRLALPLALMARSVATFSPRVAIKFSNRRLAAVCGSGRWRCWPWRRFGRWAVRQS